MAQSPDPIQTVRDFLEGMLPEVADESPEVMLKAIDQAILELEPAASDLEEARVLGEANFQVGLFLQMRQLLLSATGLPPDGVLH